MTTVESKVIEYQQRIEELFAVWKNTERHINEIFVEDGVVCPEKWFASEIRPLFLLKEAYGGNNGWSLIDDYLTKDEPIEGIWRNVSLWTKGLLIQMQSTCIPTILMMLSSINLIMNILSP